MSGRSASDAPTVETLKNGTIKATFILEQWEKFGAGSGKQPKRHSIQVQCLGKTAQIAAEYIGKHKQLTVKGELKSNNWKKADGTWVNDHYLLADSFDLIGPKMQPESGDNF